MRKTILVIAMTAASALATAGAASAGTSTTFSITTSGTLAVTAPASATLSSASPGGTATGSLGSVSVADDRGALIGTWTATVVSTAFTTGGASASETVPAASVSYWSGLATSTTGLGTFLPGQLTSANAVAIGSAQTAFSRTVGSGNSAAAWSPTLVVSIPSTVVTGTYTGTITHSVA